METQSQNNVERAYAALHPLAVTFMIKPGMRLNESELATQLGMSRAPIREALNRLSADGLIYFEHGKGFYCRKLSVTEMSDLFATRLDLELGALRQVATQASDAELSALRTWWTDIEERQDTMEIEALVEKDEEFHLRLAALAGNPIRQNYLQKIYDRIRFVRRINLEDRERRCISLSDHILILDELAKRNQSRANEILNRHLTLTEKEARRHVEVALARIYADEVT